jgi:hypothetical protein
MCGCADHVMGLELRPIDLKDTGKTLDNNLNDIIEA